MLKFRLENKTSKATGDITVTISIIYIQSVALSD